ncbi:MAG: hypothetical protein KGO93_10000 [Cyanobacteria bacterium REEB446]|nr:hypothetical protein [Cyanobacteria bacterium REEB446]
MANIDNELDDLYAQLSSLSRSGREDSSSSTASSTKSSSVKSRPSSSSGNYSRVSDSSLPRKSVSKITTSRVSSPVDSKPFSDSKVDSVKSLFANELKERVGSQKTPDGQSINKANLKPYSDKQDKLRRYINDLERVDQQDVDEQVKDQSEKKSTQNGRRLQKLSFRNETSFEIIDNSESAVAILDREELMQSKSLFANNKKRKLGEAILERDNSSYINTSAKLLKDNNNFGPLKLKKYSSR